jgi:hypothetical protein
MSYLIGEEFYCIPLKHELRRACTYTFTSFGIKKIVLFAWIEFSQGLKTFLVYIKDLLEKLFQTFLCCLMRNLLEKINFQNIILHLFKSYASILAMELFTKGLKPSKVLHF